MSREEFVQWHSSQPEKCVYCGISSEQLALCGDNLNRRTNRMSIDRKDNSRGYSIDNIVKACTRCNMVKGDFFTFEQMLEIGAKYIKPKWYNL